MNAPDDETIATDREAVRDSSKAEDAGMAEAITQGLATESVSKREVTEALQDTIPESS